MDYSGLQNLFTMSGPATSAFNQGVSDYQTQLEKQQALDLASQINPLKVRAQELTNQGFEAELPGRRATSRKLGVEADIAEAGKEGKITTQRSADELTLLGNRIKTAEAQHAQAVQAAAYMGEGPDAEARKMQLLSSGQIPPGPLYDAISTTPAKQLKAKLQSAGEAIARSKTEYITKIGEIRTKGEEDRKLEELQQAGGKYAKKGTQVSLMTQLPKMKVEERLGVLKGILTTGKLPGSSDEASPIELQYFQTMYNQDVQVMDAKNAARAQAANQGIAPTISQGEISLQPRAPLPSVGGQAPAPAAQISPQDQQAIDWAKSNPNDPRAQRILKLHGM